MLKIGRPGWVEGIPRWAVALALGAAVSGMVLALRAVGALAPLEFGAYDYLVSETSQERPRSRVVLITIREEDLTRYGHPISDEILAKAIRVLGSFGPRAIGVDVFRPIPVPPGEAQLEQAVLGDRRVVLVERVGDDEPLVPAPDYVRGTSQVGFADFVRDRDGKQRRALLMMDAPGAASFSLSLRLATRYLAAEAGIEQPPLQWEGNAMKLNGRVLRPFSGNDGAYVDEDDGGYQVLLDYRSAFQRFERYSFGDLIEGRVPAAAVEGRVALLGTVAESVIDDHMTPEVMAYGIEIHAIMVDRLLGGALSGEAGLRVLRPSAEAALILAFGLLAALLVPVLSTGLMVSAEAVLGLVIFGGLSYGAFALGWWLPAVPVAIAWYAALGATASIASFIERAERRRFAGLINRFVSERVAKQIWDLKDEFLDGKRPKGDRREITALFCDIEGFSTASERMDPEPLMEWANPIIGGLAGAIARCGGLVDDYAGDGIKADFGVFQDATIKEGTNQGIQAVEAALEMKRVIEEINRDAVDRKRQTVRVRVGIFTGRAMLGFLGSPERLKFTTLGDSVNTAARLESWDKERFAKETDECIRILIGEPTRALLQDRYELQDIGDADLKGKREKVRVYRVWGPAKPVDERSRRP
jgi:adenylate cyclase